MTLDETLRKKNEIVVGLFVTFNKRSSLCGDYEEIFCLSRAKFIGLCHYGSNVAYPKTI